MPFFVAVQYQATPDRLDDLLALIRDDFAVSTSAHPGRRFARVFQHHQEPWRLLAIEEWLQQSDFERHARTPSYVEALAACGPPPQVDTLERLQHYRHMPHLPTALACAMIAAPPDRAAEVERFVCDEQRRDALIASGLALRAVYRLGGVAGRLLVLHGWRTRDDLDAFTATSDHAFVRALTPLGAAIDELTGDIVAHFSWLQA